MALPGRRTPDHTGNKSVLMPSFCVILGIGYMSSTMHFNVHMYLVYEYVDIEYVFVL